MPRTPRRFQQGEFHHVINRANVRATLFYDEDDYRTFVSFLTETIRRFGVSLLGYCIMPNHWHLVIVPDEQRELSRALHWLTSLHAHDWSRAHEREGLGHVYQGRFRSVPIQPGINVCRVLRYVERNALAAGLVRRAEQWPWNSAHQRVNGTHGPDLIEQGFLPPEQWLEHLNAPTTDREIGEAIRRNIPIGDQMWVDSRCEALGVSRRRQRGRPSDRDQ